MRPPPEDHWAPTLPEAERERYQAAWQEFRCCRDCRFWEEDDDDKDGTGACGNSAVMRYAAFLTPEDYTCDQFARKR